VYISSLLQIAIITTSIIFIFFFYCYDHHRDLHSFPTRRSSDLKYAKEVEKLAKDKQEEIRERNRELDEGLFTATADPREPDVPRSEEHTSELQSLRHLVCRLLLEKKKKKKKNTKNIQTNINKTR